MRQCQSVLYTSAREALNNKSQRLAEEVSLQVWEKLPLTRFGEFSDHAHIIWSCPFVESFRIGAGHLDS